MIHVEERGTTTVLTIDRPERRNALDHDALEQLLDGLAAARSAGARALVLTGAGDHFCAGADLTTVEDGAFVDLLHELLDGLRTAPFPSIAAIDGAALGAGVQLSVACDLRVSTASATFGIPAAKLGLMTDQWTVHRLTRFVGQGPARAMLLTAETYRGDVAFGLGFVQRLAEPEDLLDDALAWADAIAGLAPLTIAGFKIGLNEAEAVGDWTPAYRSAFEAAWTSDDLQEGLSAFDQRRTPRFEGR